MALKYVQIETTSTCNQRCFFCPVSIDKKEKAQLSRLRLDKIIAGLKTHPIENIAISGFAEPTYDKALVKKVAALRKAGFKVTIYTNGSGLRPALSDRLLALGVNGFTINLSTLYESLYRETRGTKDLKRVIPNLDYLLAQPRVRGRQVAVVLVVIGRLDKEHVDDLREIRRRYGDSATITIIPIVEFAGKSPNVLHAKPHQGQLQGCLWERHTEWMHFNADGNAILCCQDYPADYRLGNIDDAGVDELLTGDNIRQWRDWLEGREQAPEDFLCRRCVYAKRQNHAEFLQAFFCRTCVLPAELGKENACPHCGDVGQVIEYLQSPEAHR
uniref:Iron-sulfur cluster-binding domain-containing protein n=1 Tax=Candidatus Kentrum sp. UNK TaxID=2126344 RepID=A0A451AY39_9GAMM|nr:MAG: Iron-sulfur cluster-binding domain-containing protein [Candidatus Kentron sp. UNK]VFK70837.1 MAG: Iron-sulfur cluster-binding domain-containing protein [Candidatus Kentron sp. UNK]